MENTLDLFNDPVTIIQEDKERKDALGDMPDWSTVDLNTFLLEFYSKKKTKKGYEWYPLVNKLGEGYVPNYKVEAKADAVTESMEQLANREVTMFKMLDPNEVYDLKRFIEQGLTTGDSPEQAAEDALEVVYERARQDRLKILIENKQVMHQFLVKIKSKLNLKQVYEEAQYFTKMVEEEIKSCNTLPPSQYRKQERDMFMLRMKQKLGVKDIYGRPWAWLNSLYWNCLFHWVEQAPSQILSDCARRYAYSIAYDDQVHGSGTLDPEGIW